MHASSLRCLVLEHYFYRELKCRTSYYCSSRIIAYDTAVPDTSNDISHIHIRYQAVTIKKQTHTRPGVIGGGWYKHRLQANTPNIFVTKKHHAQSFGIYRRAHREQKMAISFASPRRPARRVKTPALLAPGCYILSKKTAAEGCSSMYTTYTYVKQL